MEIIDGVRKALAMIIEADGKWSKEMLKTSFKTKVSTVIENILVAALPAENKEALAGILKLIDPKSDNEVRFVDGRMETLRLEKENMMLVSLGLYSILRMGKRDKKFKANVLMAGRCTKMVEIHKLSHAGVAFLPMGLSRLDDGAPLPISYIKRENETPEERRKLEPVSVTLGHLM